MTKINEFDITEEELKEIEEIVELARGCTDYLLSSLVNPDTDEKIELEENDQKAIYKLVLDKTMEYIEDNSFPDNEEEFSKYVEYIFCYIEKNICQ